MGQINALDNTIIMTGIQMQGKTAFLYANILKTKINFQSIKPTEGYNYERVEYEGTNLGIWDISGHEDFLPLIKTFYENIKLNAMIFMIRFEVDIFESDPHPGKNSIINDEDEKKKIQINWLVNSRKLLHILMNEEELKLKPLVVLINTLCASNKKEEDIIKDIKEFIKFDDIRTPYKDILLLELNKFDFEPVWQKTLKLILEASKEKN